MSETARSDVPTDDTVNGATDVVDGATDVVDGAANGVDAVLAPATRLLWRTHNAIHLELGGRAVVVERLPQPVVDRVASSAPARPHVRRHPIAPDAQAALSELAAQGYLWRRPTGRHDPRLTPPTPRLAGELVALTTRHGDRAAELLARRTRASVVLFGHPRLATHLAVLLAAAGVGRVRCVTRGSARLLHTAPGGVAPGDEGAELEAVVQDVLERAAPDVDTTPLPVDDVPDLTVLVLEGPYDEDRRAVLHADGAAHLVVSTAAYGGVVGPLVVPGLTSCLRCADRHRTDRDPSWSALAAQLTVTRRYDSSCDVAAEAIVAGTAAAQALAFLDGETLAGLGSVGGTLEYHPPDWRLRRRSWPAHPLCDCGGAVATSGSAE